MTLRRAGLCILLSVTLSPLIRAQNAQTGETPASTPSVASSTAAPAASVPTGPVVPAGPSLTKAVNFYRKGDYSKASDEYNAVIAADPNSPVAFAGLARVYLKQVKLADALAAANKSVALAPTNPLGHIALGEVYFRSGKIAEAEAEFVPIIKSGQAYARAYLGEARVSRASSFYKQAKRMIDVAHSIDSSDPDIADFWMSEQSLADRITALKDELAHSTTSDPKEKVELEQSLAFLIDANSRHSSCQLVSSAKSVETPFVMLVYDPQTYRGFGLKVEINGTSSKLMLDTGATGILIGRKVAEKAGVTRVAASTISGVGDRGDQSGYVGHVDSIRVAGLEFRDCYVDVSDRKTTVDDDGLIGADLFHHFLVDLDFSARKLRLSELPPRPDETMPTPSPDPQPALQLHDRYVAPEMRSYTPLYRFGHDLLIPTRLNTSVTSLFLIDSGSTFNMISPSAARGVTKVGSDSDTIVKGLNGSVKNVYRADQATLTFGHLKQQNQDIIAFDTSSISNSIGTEVSGIIGITTLGLLDVKIDYRDGLVDFTFDSQKWCQGKCR